MVGAILSVGSTSNVQSAEFVPSDTVTVTDVVVEAGLPAAGDCVKVSVGLQSSLTLRFE